MDSLTQYVIYEKISNDNNIKIRYLCNDISDAENKFNSLKEIIPNIFIDATTLIKEVKIEIPPFITQTQKICLKCNQKFLKKGNLDLCFNCDELDIIRDKLVGSNKK